MAFFTFFPEAASEENSPILQVKPKKDTTSGSGGGSAKIMLEAINFDPMKERVEVASAWSKSYDSNEKGHFILQFSGPVRSEWKDRVEGMGVNLRGYVPQHAFLAEFEASLRSDLMSLPFVRWVGIFEPAYRVTPSLLGSGERTKMEILAFPGFDTMDLASKIERKVNSAEILSVSSGSMKVEVHTSYLSDLASIKGVHWIEPCSESKPMNNIARWTMQSGQQEYTPVHDNGLRGENQIITIADTGIYTGHEVFHDNDDPIGPSHRKILSYYVPAGSGGSLGDYSGHGTHVAGTVSGDAPTYGVYNGLDGQAFQSKIEIQDIENSSGGFYPPSDLINLFQPAFDNGVRIHNNSWSSFYSRNPPNVSDYNDLSQMIDNFMWNNKNFQTVWSMGNYGPENRTLTIQPQAKNTISVGATFNGENGNLIADFSSRGPADDNRIKPTVVAPGAGPQVNYDILDGYIISAYPPSFPDCKSEDSSLIFSP